jgi:poly(ADP-ribose) glycohydrolase
VQLLAKHVSATVTLEAEFVRHILANAFFGNMNNTKGDKSYGLLNFWQLYTYGSDDGVSNARIVCLLCYFYVIKQTPSEGHKITFQRLSLNDPPPPSSAYSGPIPPDWRNNGTLINTEQIHIHVGGMESAEATAFVDFANRDLHIHQVIASATQEEVLFSACPEAFPGILFCERMLDDEVIIIKGCRRFCDYSGYLFTFEFAKAYIPPLPAQDIIAIDAVYASHFKEPQNIRDLNKAFLGFLQCVGDRNKISTGYWGCGAFGGDKVHKFLQQVCAATLANTPLYFSCFNDTDMCNQLQSILQAIHEAKATVADVFLIMTSFQRQSSSFSTFFIQEIANLKKLKPQATASNNDNMNTIV